jgi:type VI secretion system protein ImpF
MSPPSKYELSGPVTISILDRLIDDEPKVRSEPALTRAKSITQLKASLRRDLENLLNTRCTPESPAESSVEVAQSVYAYGIQDITGMRENFLYDRERMLSEIEQAVRNFEPRLEAVRVSVVPTSDIAQVLRFVIEGVLKIEPTPERVVFDAALELTSGEYQLTGKPSAR